MNGHPTEWLPGLVALAAGLLIGFFLLRRSLRQGTAAATPPAVAPAPRREAEARYAALCAQLRDLEDNASLLEPEPLARERYRLECAAAAALLEIEATPAAERETAATAGEALATPAVAPAPANPALRGFLWGAGGVAALALLGLFVSREATVRREGGSITGNIPGEERLAVPDEIARLQARVGARPDDLEARLELAFAHLQRRELMAVFEHTQYVLERRPRDLVVLATHARAGLERLLLPSFAEPIAREGHTPALVLPTGSSGFVDPATGGATLHNILIPVDSRPPAGRAIELAVALADVLDQSGAVIHLLHAGPDFPELELPAALEPRLRRRAMPAPVVEAILETAEKVRADLIVMPTRGHDSLADTLRGSTTEQVLRRANLPVLAVPAH